MYFISGGVKLIFQTVFFISGFKKPVADSDYVLCAMPCLTYLAGHISFVGIEPKLTDVQ